MQNQQDRDSINAETPVVPSKWYSRCSSRLHLRYRGNAIRAVYNLLNLNHVPIQINYESKPMIMIRFIDYMINYPVDSLSTLLMLLKPETL